MGQHYNQLGADERHFIQRHQDRGPAWIGLQLGRRASSVSREMRRNRCLSGGYDSVTAQACALARTRRGLVKLAEGTSLRDHVLAQIRAGWSPQQISGKLKPMPDNTEPLQPAPGQVSHETIYRAIYVLPKGELRKELTGLLRQGRKLRRPRSQGRDRRGKLKNMVSIHQRPESVLTRQLFGDWEGDLIKGEDNASAIGTLVERKSRFVILVKMKNCGADAALTGFERALNRLPEFARTSLTYDQGKEMARHAELAKQLNLKVYFCDPHSPWQRGTNENMNGLVRQYLPKGLDLSIYSQKQLDRIAESLNTRPRAMHSFQTPQEVFNTEIQKPRVALQI